jgi:aminoglycoside phosphotransferase (APT) family kinase protein
MPAVVTGGFDTAIYAFAVEGGPEGSPRDLVLRAFRDAGGATDPLFERDMQNGARALGFPAPQVIAASDDASIIGRRFTVMERCRGRTMLDDLFGTRVLRTFAALGRLHAQLHGLEAARVPALAARTGAREFDDVRQLIEASGAYGLSLGADWLDAHKPAPGPLVACHGDFHPLNVLVEGGRVTGVIDWAGARLAPAEWDIGATVALITQGPVSLPGPALAAANMARRWFARQYLRAYRSVRAYDESAVTYYEMLRLLAVLAEAAGHLQVAAGALASWDLPNAFADARLRARIARRVRAVTGAAIVMPDEHG